MVEAADDGKGVRCGLWKVTAPSRAVRWFEQQICNSNDEGYNIQQRCKVVQAMAWEAEGWQMLASEVITDGWVSRGINDGEGERVELLIESMEKNVCWLMACQRKN